VEINEGTSFVVECALQALLSRQSRLKGYLAIAGQNSFLRTRFPDACLTPVSEQVKSLVDVVLCGLPGTVGSIAGRDYQIQLAIHFDRDTARDWIKNAGPMTNSSGGNDKTAVTTIAEMVATAVDTLPTAYAERFEILKRFQDNVRQEIAKLLQPSLQREAEAMKSESYADKQTLSVWVNAQLRELGLALRCPNTGRPAILVADMRDAETQSSRFRYAIRDDAGRATKTISSKQLPSMELMPDEPRVEGRAKGPVAGQSDRR